ncbi:hypothetical protein SAMN04489733_2487 [Amycolatopsis keratiniphila]|nr:hypothetical protein SAMN04489733_2487 [Amycolatopsis keratiniphila]
MPIGSMRTSRWKPSLATAVAVTFGGGLLTLRR